MLSYRHAFHAGGWADVHKHVALALIVAHLRRKATPFTVVDAFAGDAVYDLTGAEARKTGEWAEGIARLFNAPDAPAGVAEYLAVVRAENAGGSLRRYPGSPALVRRWLRADDRLILNELHPSAHAALVGWARGDRRIAVHKRDAFEFLGAVVTPRLRRGLVLIDPAYEVKDDYAAVGAAVARLLTAWPGGTYAVWYPVLPAARHAALRAELAALPAKEAVGCEIAPPKGPAAEAERGMLGAGLVVLNPPWQFAERMAEAGAWLATTLWQPGAGRHDVTQLAARAA